MLPDSLVDLLSGPWGLGLMSVLVLGDAFTVVIPGEVAVTVMAALSVAVEEPALWAVIACAAAAAAAGDLLCYGLGRMLGVERWRWMRAPRMRRARRWAQARLESGTAVVLFTARFIPFARLAVNIVAGATRVPLPRYAALIVLAASGWAVYQAGIGATVAAIVPGAPLVTVLISVGVAVALGVLIDLGVNAFSRRRTRGAAAAAD